MFCLTRMRAENAKYGLGHNTCGLVLCRNELLLRFFALKGSPFLFSVDLSRFVVSYYLCVIDHLFMPCGRYRAVTDNVKAEISRLTFVTRSSFMWSIYLRALLSILVLRAVVKQKLSPIEKGTFRLYSRLTWSGTELVAWVHYKMELRFPFLFIFVSLQCCYTECEGKI